MSSMFQDCREPPFRVGDLVKLNSGGPRMMIVDVGHASVTTAWRDANGSALERSFPLPCVHRISPL